MSQSGTYENTDETIDEQRVEELVFHFLVFVQPTHHEVCAYDAHKPTHTIPAQGYGTNVSDDLIGIPEDEAKKICHFLMGFIVKLVFLVLLVLLVLLVILELLVFLDLLGLNIKPKVHDVSILYHVFLSLDTHLTSFLDGSL